MIILGDNGKMKYHFNLIVPALAGTLIACSSLGCGDSNTDETSTTKTNRERAVTVSVQELVPEAFTERIQLTGTVKAYEDVMISPEEGGVVNEWKVSKGHYVKKNDVLVTMKDDVLRPNYEAADAQYKTTELTYQKQRSVFAEQGVSEWQVKTSEYGRDAAKAQAEMMHARLERTQIRSPVGGILDERFVDEGEMAQAGGPIARVVNISHVKILINVPERYAGSITLGTAVTMTVLAYPGEEFSGRIGYIGATVSPDNRTFPVEVVISNPGSKLKPEMIGRVFILQSVKNKALLVDGDIIQQVDRQKFVVYVVKDGRAVERSVQLGGHGGDKVEILAGLEIGDRVITSGYQNVADGQAVVVAR